MIEKLRQYFIDIDVLDENSRINVDFLGDEPIEYVIEPIPTEKVFKEYTDGSYIEQFEFQLASRESYGSDVIVNMQNNAFYENLSNVIEKLNYNKVLPKIDGIQSIEVLNQGVIQDSGIDTAKYSIQMRILIYKEVL